MVEQGKRLLVNQNPELPLSPYCIIDCTEYFADISKAANNFGTDTFVKKHIFSFRAVLTKLLAP
jgi:hypothetical protein